MSDEPSATERRAQLILQELLRTGKVSVLRLAKRLKVSPATIRRDLGELEQRGLLRRSHGDILAIGAGTNATQVARSVCLHKGITVLTNAVNVAMELSHRDDLKVIVTGGFLSGVWFALVGPAAIEC